MKKHNSSFLFAFMFCMFILFLTACSGEKNEGNTGTSNENNGVDNGEQLILDLSVTGPEKSYPGYGARKFKEELEKLTDDQLSVTIHYANALGGEREVVEMMGIDSLHMAATSSGPFGTWTEEFMVFDLPFLFDNYEHAIAVMDGEIGDELAQKFEKDANVKILGYWSNGFRQMTNSVRPIKHVSDVEGLKHRVQQNELQIDSWRAYGADPTPISYPEVYSALQQGVVDGQSNPLVTAHLGNYYEVQQYASLLNEIFSPYPLMISKNFFDSLPIEHQEAIQKAADLSVVTAREQFNKEEQEAYEFFKENGITVVDDPDVESFKEKVEPVYEKWAPKIGEDLIERIRNYQY